MRKICTILLLFMAALAEGWQSGQGDALAYEYGYQHNDSVTITLAPGMLKKTRGGRLMLNSGGGEEPDDHGYKPRPGFFGHELMGFWHEPSDLLGLLVQESVFFSHYPGNQENHPAHPEGGQVYTVPGINGLPLGGGSNGGAGAGSTSDKRRYGSQYDASGGEGLSGSGDGSGGGSSGWGSSRNSSKKPKKAKNEVTKKLSDGTELVAWVDDSLYCPICIDLIDECAIQCEECENYFCADHHESLLSCPQCREDKPPYNVVKKRRAIAAILWSCVHCDAEGSIDNMKGHVHSCPGGEGVQCSNPGCEQMLIANDMEEHQRVCPFALRTCINIGCEHRCPNEQMVTHLLTCNFAQIHCPNDCGLSILRGELEEHRFVCDMRMVYFYNMPMHAKEKAVIEEAEKQGQAAGVPFNTLLAAVKRLPSFPQAAEAAVSVVPQPDVACKWCGCNFAPDALESHHSQCESALIACEDCMLQLPRKELDIHKKYDCKERRELCPDGCGKKLKECEIVYHQSFECPKILVVCDTRYKGDECNVQFRASERRMHQKVCKYRMTFGKFDKRLYSDSEREEDFNPDLSF